MASDPSVVADAAAGAAVVAGMRIAMSAVGAAGATGALRFGGPQGSVLRPLSFGERTELVSSSSTTDAVAARILDAATLERGDGSTTLLEVLAMWLAGAELDAPGFMETTLLVARAAAWQPQDLFAAPAREIDRLAVHLGEQSEWKSLVFAEDPAETTIESVRERFAERLLRRSMGTEERIAARSKSAAPTTSLAQNELSGGQASARPPVSAPTAEGGQAEAGPPFSSLSEASTRQSMPLARGARLLVPLTHEPRSETRAATAGEPSREVITPLSFTIRERGASAPPLPTAPAQPAAVRTAAAAEWPLSHGWQQSESVREPPIPWEEHVAEQNGEVQFEANMRRRRDAARSAGGDAGGPLAYAPWNEDVAEQTGGLQFVANESRRRDPFDKLRAGDAGDPNIAAMLAALLDDESDLRGVER
ncbi:MAG TPA: hypothetical protein VNI54_01550 [Thermoanaerobaculia bacterium]|nr:hypothetical protein [Thermoanaerobaculia bacterium]